MADLRVGVGVGAAHEAVADHADVEFFLCHAHATQPCCSRTLIMAARMLFQVLGFIITSLREHAAVPADVAEGLRQSALAVAQPVAGVLGDVELAVRVVDLAVAAGLVVIAQPFTVPSFWATWKSMVQGRNASVIFFSASSRTFLSFQSYFAGSRRDFGRVVAQRVEQGVGHVGLEADGLRAVGFLERVEHVLP